MSFRQRFLGYPPNTYELLQRGDIAGLAAALGHKLPWVRRDAVLTLATLNDPQFTGAFTTALNDSNEDVRHAAHAALERLNDSQPREAR